MSPSEILWGSGLGGGQGELGEVEDNDYRKIEL